MPARALPFALILTVATAATALAQTPPPGSDGSGPRTGPSPEAREAMRKACAVDIKTSCSELQPGQRLGQCLRENFAKLSPDCQTALKSMRQRREPQS